MGQLNIKDEALIADAKALAELLGTSTTNAVRRAVQERLARERMNRDEERRRRYDAITFCNTGRCLDHACAADPGCDGGANQPTFANNKDVAVDNRLGWHKQHIILGARHDIGLHAHADAKRSIVR